MKSLRFLALAVTVAVTGLSPAAGAQDVSLMVAKSDGVWAPAGSSGAVYADLDPQAFAVRATNHPQAGATPGSTRVVLMARVTANATTLQAITTAYGAQSGIDLSGGTQTYNLGNTTSGTYVELAGSPALKMHGTRTNDLFAQLISAASGANWATAFPNAVKGHSIPWVNPGTPFPAPAAGNYGLAMPGQHPDWVIGGCGETFWSQSFLGRYLNQSSTPGGTTTVFSPSRLVERCILNQSTNGYNAADFIRNAAYRTGFSNQFTLEVQALVILPAENIAAVGPVPERRKIKVIKTDVYTRQVTLTPGTDEPNVPSYALALRPGIMFDVAGAGGPVCFNLGLAVDPFSATFAVPGSSAEPIVVPVFKLYPWDALSTYYIALRPTAEASKIVNIDVTVPNAASTDPAVFILPPLADAQPLG